MPAQILHQPRTLRQGNTPAPRGFTLVELMVVLVIIAIIGGLIVIGIKSVFDTTRDDSTESRMEMLDNFLAAYANAENARAGGQGNTEANALPSFLRPGPDPQPAGRYSTVDSAADAGTGPTPAMAFNSGSLTAPVAGAAPPYLANDPTRYPPRFAEDNWVIEPAVARTQAVLRRLLTIPANQSTFASLPADAKTRVPATVFNGADSILSHVDPLPGPPTSALNPPLIVDGHGHPIIYVPPTGLTGLKFKDGTWLDPRPSTNDPDRLVAVDGRAFWASAGPDGTFAGHPGDDGVWNTADDIAGADDNVYSTEVLVKKITPP